MEITEIKISLRDEGKLRGFANITFDDVFVVRGLKIIRGLNRYFIAMPSRCKPDGAFSDIAHPITMDFRRKMESAVLEKYWENVSALTEAGVFEVQYEM